jgi:rRNA maturation endonuclease Nob1
MKINNIMDLLEHFGLLGNIILINSIFSSEKSVFPVEKYYCDRCRLLYDTVEICKICGTLVKNKIKIEVQKQPDKK